MNKTSILASIILVFSLIWYGNGVLSTAVAQEPIPHAPLRVSIEFSEKMPPLDPVLYPGNTFDRKVATALLKKKEIPITWAKIPKWRAGGWEYTHDTVTRIVKYDKGKPVSDEPSMEVVVDKATFIQGTQLDRKADVWEQYGISGWGVADLGDSKMYSYGNFSAPGESEHPDYHDYEESTDFVVDKNTGVILAAVQTKTWRRNVYVAPGIMKQEAVYTHYDEHGEPVDTHWSTSLCKRLHTFNEQLAKNDVELNAYESLLLSLYLKHNGLANLVPPMTKAMRDEEVREVKKMSDEQLRSEFIRRGLGASTKTSATSIAAKH